MSRGKPKSKISDISRTPPTREELEALTNLLGTKELHPIAAAILGSVLVEHELEVELRRRLKCADHEWNELLSDVGPLRNFHSKIVMGRRLRMYGEDVRFDLNIVRNVRNQFAHSKKLVDFDNPLVIKEILSAKPVPGERRNFKWVTHNKHGAQYAYISLCMLLAVYLIRIGKRAAHSQARYYQKRAARFSPWTQGILGVLAPPIDAEKLPHLLSQPNPNVDPSPLAQVLTRAALRVKAAKDSDSKDT